MNELMAERGFSSNESDLENSRKKQRVVEEYNDIVTPDYSMTINPVTQQFNRPNMVVPDFNCASFFNNGFIRLQLSNLLLKYKAVVLFFYESDFSESAYKDLTLINNNVEKFESLNALPLAMSSESEAKHKTFIEQSFSSLPQFPLAADITRSVSHHFKVINPETGLNQRAAFIIDRTRQVRFSFILEDDRLNHSMNTICTILQNL